jgi:hypothetical protein
MVIEILPSNSSFFTSSSFISLLLLYTYYHLFEHTHHTSNSFFFSSLPLRLLSCLSHFLRPFSHASPRREDDVAREARLQATLPATVNFYFRNQV